ncbi:uncharacterized protein TNCV_3146731 [Trichonephila clavipes]|nr:uncharacterized protein TNCV_3146731 [Trichonephila clavipes]
MGFISHSDQDALFQASTGYSSSSTSTMSGEVEGTCFTKSCISADGIGRLHIIDRTLAVIKCIDIILQPKLLPSIRDIFTNNASFVFQHDSAPCHTVNGMRFGDPSGHRTASLLPTQSIFLATSTPNWCERHSRLPFVSLWRGCEFCSPDNLCFPDQHSF